MMDAHVVVEDKMPLNHQCANSHSSDALAEKMALRLQVRDVPAYTPTVSSPLNPAATATATAKDVTRRRRNSKSMRRQLAVSPSHRLLRQKAADAMRSQALSREVAWYERRAAEARKVLGPILHIIGSIRQRTSKAKRYTNSKMWLRCVPKRRIEPMQDRHAIILKAHDTGHYQLRMMKAKDNSHRSSSSSDGKRRRLHQRRRSRATKSDSTSFICRTWASLRLDGWWWRLV